jgi:hypothetical protein
MKNLTRYMSLEKCLDFITYKKLYLARFDSFDDQLEGHSLTQLAERAGLEIEDLAEDGRSKLEAEVRKKVLFGSCWYQGLEDLSMWDRFRSERGLAVSVDQKSLTEAYKNSDDQNDFKFLFDKLSDGFHPPSINYKFADEIRYVSKHTRKKSGKSRLGLLKHSAFGHEKEFRFVVRQKAGTDKIMAKGLFWNIPNFSELSFTIITNPYMKDEFSKMIRSYIKSINLENIKVKESQFRSFFTRN